MQFELNCKLFKAFMKAADNLNQEISLIIKKDGWETTKMDTSHIALLFEKLQSTEFINYPDLDAQFESKFIFDSSKNFLMFLKQLKTENLRITIENDQLIIATINREVELNYTIQRKKIDEKDLEEINMNSLNSMEFDNKYEISCELLNQILTLKSDLIRFEQTSTNLIISVNDQRFTILNKSLHDSENQFSTTYMRNLLVINNELFNKQSKQYKDSKILLQYKSEAPLKATIKQSDMYFAAIYYIAPRVEENNNEEEIEETSEPKIEKKEQPKTVLGYASQSVKAFLESEKNHIDQEFYSLRSQSTTFRNQIYDVNQLIEKINYTFSNITEKQQLLNLVDNKLALLSEVEQKQQLIQQNDREQEVLAKDLQLIDNDLLNLYL